MKTSKYYIILYTYVFFVALSGNLYSQNNLLQNSGFTEDAKEGNLAESGNAASWAVSKGAPELRLGDGCEDVNFIRLSANNERSDGIYQAVNLEAGNYEFSACIKNLAGQVLPVNTKVQIKSYVAPPSDCLQDQEGCGIVLLEIVLTELMPLDQFLDLIKDTIIVLDTTGYITIELINDEVGLRSIDLDNISLLAIEGPNPNPDPCLEVCDKNYATGLGERMLENFFKPIQKGGCIYEISTPRLRNCYSVAINWGDGSSSQNVPVATNIIHDYLSNGVYNVCIDILVNDGLFSRPRLCERVCKEIIINCRQTFECGMSVATCYAHPIYGGGPVAVIYDVRPNETAPIGVDWNNAALGMNKITEIHPINWDVDSIGEVFGIAINNQKGDIFLAASDIYGSTRAHGMAGSGGIYKTEGNSLNITTSFVSTTNSVNSSCSIVGSNQIPNTGNAKNGLGNIAFDPYNKTQLFATNTEDGRIYRIDINTGAILSIYDPFSTGIDSPGIEGFGELIWGIGVFEENGIVKVYFARQLGNTTPGEIWSIALDPSGNFPGLPNTQCIYSGSEVLEISDIPSGGQGTITDIAFSSSCRMIVAERGHPHDAHVYEYDLVDGNWVDPTEYFIGISGSNQSNSAGGVDYGYSEKKGDVFAGCDSLVWGSGNFIKITNGLVYGLQGIRQGCNMATNDVSMDLLVDFNGITSGLGQGQKGQIGDVEVFRCTNCPKPEINCDSLTVMIEETQVEGDLCCYNLDIKNNFDNNISKLEIELASPNWKINTQLIDPNFIFDGAPTGNNLCIRHTSGFIPMGQINDVLEFCLDTLGSPHDLQQKFAFKWYQETEKDCETVVCIDSLMTMCDPVPPATPCVTIDSVSLDCNKENAFEYIYCFTVTNNSGTDASSVILSNLPPGFNFSLTSGSTPVPSILLNLSPNPLISGNTSATTCVKVIAPYPIINPTDVCFTSGLLDADFRSCCHSNGEICVTLESCCDPCEDNGVVVEPLMVDDGSCCYKLDLINNCTYNVFTRVETEIITPGVVFGYHAIGGPDANDWITAGNTGNTLLSWQHITGVIPSGTIQDVIQFCLDGIDDPSERPQEVVLRWYGNNSKEPLCTDTLSFDCEVDNQCLLVSEQEAFCDRVNGKYVYNFTVTNNSSIPFNATDVVVGIVSPTGLSLTPSGGIFDVNPLSTGSSVNLSTCIESPTGSLPSLNQIVFKYRLLYWDGESSDTCCFEDKLDTISVQPCVDMDVFDLALTNQVVSSGPYVIGQKVDFETTVHNQGNVDASNIKVAYRVPSGFIFNNTDNADYSDIGGIKEVLIGNLIAGTRKTRLITLEIAPGATNMNLITDAEIVEATGGSDVDSNPGDNLNDPSELLADDKITDMQTGIEQDDDLDQDDFDPALIMLDETCCPNLENRITNGDFEEGNAGFESDYIFQPDISQDAILPGSYGVISSTDASTICDQWSIDDHTTDCDGEGNFLVVNGQTGQTGSSTFWSQTITGLDPEKPYELCAYFKNLQQCCFDVTPTIYVSLGELRVDTIELDSLGADPCAWQNINIPIEVTGTSVTINLELDETFVGDGNDFAMDDIALYELAEQELYISTQDQRPDGTPEIMASVNLINAVDDTLASPECNYRWTIGKVTDLDIAGQTYTADPFTMAMGDATSTPAWSTTTDFPGYDGSQILSGTLPGDFDEGMYFIELEVYDCDCFEDTKETKFVGWYPGWGLKTSIQNLNHFKMNEETREQVELLKVSKF